MKNATALVLVLGCLLVAATAVRAEEVVFRQAAGTEFFGGSGHTVTTTVFDDKWMPAWANLNDYGLTFFAGMDNKGGNPFDGNQMMIAISEMFSLLPATQDSQTIQINEATLRVIRNTRWSNDEGNQLTAYRVKTDWLLGQAPGAAQTNSNRPYRDMTNETPWADATDGRFGEDDVDTAYASPPVTWTTAIEYDFDVTDIVARMYELGENYGFTIAHTSGTITTSYIRPWQSTDNKSDPPNEPTINGPSLYIDYEYVSSVVLGDVNGDGVVDGLDIQPFVDLLTGGGYQAEADINDDAVVDGLDIQPFVDIITGAGGNSVPEPATLSLLALGGIVALARRRDRRC